MTGRPTFDPGFTTHELAAVYTPQATVEAILEFEAALALALADAGVAPRDEADAMASACRAVSDPDRVLASTWEVGTPIITLRDVVVSSIKDHNARRWFHFGATSQDAIDTAQMLQARSALSIFDERLSSVGRRLRDLTVEHRRQPHMGRTFLQDAVPTTFGFRTATWLDAVLGHVAELRSRRDHLVIQLGGPVGTMEAYGDRGEAVLSSLSERLQLEIPDISWHGDRTRVVALAQSVERVALTMARIGSDIALLASSAINEIDVRSGGSSSMPDKRNPIDSIRAVAAASACSGAVGMLTGSASPTLDRGVGAWRVEWIAVPLVFQTGDASVEAIATCLDSLEVDNTAMAANAGTSPQGDVDMAQIDHVLKASEELLG